MIEMPDPTCWKVKTEMDNLVFIMIEIHLGNDDDCNENIHFL